jgi:signal peptidase II
MPFELLLAAGVIFSLDRCTKMLVARYLFVGQSVSVTSWLRIRRVDNAHQAALRQHPRLLLLVLAALFLGICLMVRHGLFFQRQAAQLGLGMALGGACSNVYDQLRHAAVLDFLEVGWWPVFNLADVAITVGVCLALWFLY